MSDTDGSSEKKKGGEDLPSATRRTHEISGGKRSIPPTFVSTTILNALPGLGSLPIEGFRFPTATSFHYSVPRVALFSIAEYKAQLGMQFQE